MIASPIAPLPAPQPGALRVPARIVLLNVKYSPNLGDGLLSECLERELSRALPGCEVVSVDLAGRETFSGRPGAARAATMAALQNCPTPLRRIAAWAMLRVLLGLRLGPHYRKGLAGAEAVVLGGGNLLTDADLNFPMKISGALAEAARLDLPVAVYAVGVSPTWSRAGNRIFAGALQRSRLIWASVRDRQSQQAWAGHLPWEMPPQLVVDPGMLASQHYPQPPSRHTARKVALCVTNPLAVRYHSTQGSADTLDAWYPQAIRSLVMQGFEVALFTNGSPEDHGYLHRQSAPWLRHARGTVTLHPRLHVPADLARFVSGCEAVVGHRMHACIAAHSFGVPALGLRWDIKLDSFFALAGRTRHMLDPAAMDAGELGPRVAAAIDDRFDPAPLIARARREIASFAAHLQANLAPLA